MRRWGKGGRSGDRFEENSCEGAKSMDRRGSEEKMENKVVVEKKIKVGMCRRFAKRRKGGRGFLSALLHGERLSTMPKKSAFAIRALMKM